MRTFHSGIQDDKRRELKHCVKSPTEADPLLNLKATDAAREG